MSAPALRTFANAGTEVSGDNLNTFQQTCDIFNDLRAFIGTTGIQVYARGRSAVNDGFGGVFYWNGSSTTADDNLDVIAPTGQATGRWIRVETLTGEFASLPADQTGGDVADSVPFLDASESGALNTVLVSNFLKNALTTMTAKAVPVLADTVMIGDSADSGAVKRSTLTEIFAASTGNTAVWPKGSLFGLTLSRATATTFGVATGSATNEDSGANRDMTLASAFTKSISSNFVQGTGNGALDTGGIAATTWYHIHLIRKDSDGAIDILMSLSATAPSMPSGWTARRRIGSIKTDGASQIIAFNQEADEFLWDVATVDVDATNPGAAAVTRTLNVPIGVKVIALINVGADTVASNFTVNISALDVSDQAAQATTGALTGFSCVASEGAANGWDFSGYGGAIRTNTSAQIRSRTSGTGAGDRLGIICRGWLDRRGQG